ncbi:MAG: helix-turn-helix transcriptional regulator [Acidimicrobiaceae bacterium]|nr:helix-turn-helix transcriptional regulator [Acidimicrobiaceae bacterium]
MLENEGYLRPGKATLKAVYVISVAAELAGMHPQTLRIYERKGLVYPLRTDGGSRRYSEEDVQRLRRIQELTNAGLNLEGVKKFMELENEIASLKQELEVTKAELKRQREESDRLYKREIVPFSQGLRIFRDYQGLV